MKKINIRKILNAAYVIIILIFITPASGLSQTCNTADANGDGKVDGIDYAVWFMNFGKNVIGPQNGNFDCVGTVDGIDYAFWFINFGKTLSSPTPVLSISPIPSVTQEGYFTISVADESFCLYSINQQTMKLATENFLGKNSKIPVGKIKPGSGEFNYGFGGLPDNKYWRWWSWHMDPAETVMADAAIELCDALPSTIEYDGLETGSYCPWLAKVTALTCRSGN